MTQTRSAGILAFYGILAFLPKSLIRNQIRCITQHHQNEGYLRAKEKPGEVRTGCLMGNPWKEDTFHHLLTSLSCLSMQCFKQIYYL